MVQPKLADKLLIVRVNLKNLVWGLKIIKHKATPGPGRAPDLPLLSMSSNTSKDQGIILTVHGAFYSSTLAMRAVYLTFSEF